MITELLASAIIWLTGPIPLTIPAGPPAYTCTTDYECEQECVARSDVHCDDWILTPEGD